MRRPSMASSRSLPRPRSREPLRSGHGARGRTASLASNRSDFSHPRRVRLRYRARARSGILAFADTHSQQIPKASRRWPLMQRRARYGDAGGAWIGSTSAQKGSRWCSAQTARSRSRGTSANQPQRGQAIMQLVLPNRLRTNRTRAEMGCIVSGESNLLVREHASALAAIAVARIPGAVTVAVLISAKAVALSHKYSTRFAFSG
jgi:hypothetical protein